MSSPVWSLWPIKSRLLVREKGKEEMNRNMPERMLLLQKLKRGSHKESEKPKKKKKKNNKFLITVTVLRSAGPMKFMVNNDDPVSRVINAALKSYAREGRLPILGSNNTHFFLYCRTDFEAMSPMESIGSRGGRSFVLCKKETQPQVTEDREEMVAGKSASRSGGSWKAWLKKIFSFKVQSH